MVVILLLAVFSPFIILAFGGACIAIEKRNDHKLFVEMLKARGQL